VASSTRPRAERGREWHLISRPESAPEDEHFELVEVDLPRAAEGQLLVRNTWMSVDPSARLRMREQAPDYMPRFALGQALEGWAVGEVVESHAPGFAVGERVLHPQGWRDFALLEADGGGGIAPELLPGDAESPAREYLGPLSWVGLTAYAGLLDVAELRPGDVVFVSAAAGAVGGLAVQIAKLRGHRVIASAGSVEKVSHLREALGADAAFCYRDGPALELLRHCAPEGIDLYFDNVGGEQLEAALELMRPQGRIALCGSISTYNGEGPAPGPSNLFNAVTKGLTLRGFLARMYAHRMAEFRAEMRDWIAEGRILYPEQRYAGLELAPRALMEQFAGRNVGKVLVQIADDGEQG
jgi:NADPH-dependent curcumin reductase CurA